MTMNTKPHAPLQMLVVPMMIYQIFAWFATYFARGWSGAFVYSDGFSINCEYVLPTPITHNRIELFTIFLDIVSMIFFDTFPILGVSFPFFFLVCVPFSRKTFATHMVMFSPMPLVLIFSVEFCSTFLAFVMIYYGYLWVISLWMS